MRPDLQPQWLPVLLTVPSGLLLCPGYIPSEGCSLPPGSKTVGSQVAADGIWGLGMGPKGLPELLEMAGKTGLKGGWRCKRPSLAPCTHLFIHPPRPGWKASPAATASPTTST